jgi:serine/threonine-protein kinase
MTGKWDKRKRRSAPVSRAYVSFLTYVPALIFAATPALYVFCAPPVLARTQTTYERGMAEFGHRKFKESIKTLESAVKENPNDVDAWTEMGRGLMMEDRYKEGLVACTRAIEINPKNFRAYTFRAYCNFRLRKIREGLEDSDKAIKYYQVNPFDPSILWALDNRARAYKMIRRNDLANADLEFLQVYDLLNKAIKFREWARLNDAVTTVDQAIKNMPKNSDFWFFRGVVNGNRRDFWEAAADFSNAIRNTPTATFLYYFRGDAYQQLNQHREAVQDFTNIINAGPRLAAYRFTCETGRLRDQGLREDMAVITIGDIHYLRAQSEAELGRTSEAIDDLNQALKLDPTDTPALTLRAELVSESGKNDIAVKDFSEAIRQNPGDWSKYHQRANAYMKLGKVQEALNDYTQIVKLNPNEAGSYMIRALARQRTGDFDGALQDYSQVVKLNPNDDDALLSRGICLKLLKRYKEALEDFDRAEKINPENKSLVMEEKAKLYVETGEEGLARSQVKTLDSALAAKRPNYLLIGSTAFIVLCSGGAFLFLRSRKRKPKKGLEGENAASK